VILRLLSYNIEYGGVGREAALASVILSASPDLVVLQEATRPEVVKHLADACGMKHWGGHLGESLGFLSRVDIAHSEWHALMLARRRFLELTLTREGIRIFGVHLSAIHSNVFEARRVLEVRALLRAISPFHDQFHFLAGDFNTMAEGAAFDPKRLPPRLQALYWMGGGRIRRRALALMLAVGYTDGYRALHSDEGYTFPTWDPQVRLDYLFMPAKSVAAVKRCEVLRNAPGAREASDHFPLLAEIELP